METRANHVLIGAFTLAVLAGAVFFAVWLAKIGSNTGRTVYDIYFEGSVTGLSKGADVRYNGIKVGEVILIRIAPKDPNKVQVRVDIGTDTPVTDDTVASLEIVGITGVTFVALSGSSPYSSKLNVAPGEDYAVIRSRRSRLEELVADLPRLLSQASSAIGSIEQIVGAENRAELAKIIKNTRVITDGLADPKTGLAPVVANVATITDDLKVAAQNISRISVKIDKALSGEPGTVTGDLYPLIAEARQAVHNFNNLAANADQLVKDNKAAFGDFAGRGLPEMVAFITEARNLVQSLDRLSARMQSDPGRLIWGEKDKGYQPKGEGK